MLKTREKLAIFRMDCASFDPTHPIHPNNYPYFVGAFDTVAALGSVAQAVKFVAFYAAGAAVASWLISRLPNLPRVGPYFTFLDFKLVFFALVRITYCKRVSHLHLDAREI